MGRWSLRRCFQPIFLQRYILGKFRTLGLFVFLIILAMRFPISQKSKTQFHYPSQRFFFIFESFKLTTIAVNCFRCLIITKCEVVSPALEMEIRSEIKREDTGIILKPKQEIVTKSAAQIVHEQSGKWVFQLSDPFFKLDSWWVLNDGATSKFGGRNVGRLMIMFCWVLPF